MKTQDCFRCSIALVRAEPQPTASSASSLPPSNPCKTRVLPCMHLPRTTRKSSQPPTARALNLRLALPHHNYLVALETTRALCHLISTSLACAPQQRPHRFSSRFRNTFTLPAAPSLLPTPTLQTRTTTKHGRTRRLRQRPHTLPLHLPHGRLLAHHHRYLAHRDDPQGE